MLDRKILYSDTTDFRHISVMLILPTAGTSMLWKNKALTSWEFRQQLPSMRHGKTPAYKQVHGWDCAGHPFRWKRLRRSQSPSRPGRKIGGGRQEKEGTTEMGKGCFMVLGRRTPLFSTIDYTMMISFCIVDSGSVDYILPHRGSVC